MATTTRNLLHLLQQKAETAGDKGISAYTSGKLDDPSRFISYSELFQTALHNSTGIKDITGVTPISVTLLHFDNHVDNIEWFWSVVAAGLVPAVSTPMTNDAEGRKRHLEHLQKVLDQPIILTTEKLRGDFAAVEGLNVQTIEDIQTQMAEKSSDSEPSSDSEGPDSSAASDNESNFSFSDRSGGLKTSGLTKDQSEVAALMLTSGSSGNAKAVVLRHGQILQAVSGKSIFHGTKKDDVFLNWIGFDHVASLTETHLHAMHLGADQVHVPAADLLAKPSTFLDLVHRHRVAYTFAPNFFMAGLVRELQGLKGSPSWDLSCLRACISGGEANVVETAKEMSDLLSKYQVPDDFIRPGFGMTETCAGSIYNNNCPNVDLENQREFASLGSCIPGLEMRVSTENGVVAVANEVGNLEIGGPILFSEYRNNPEATSEAFTEDGWFSTGDLAFLDSNGHLNLAGRSKETIIVNGVKYFPHELESAIEDAKIQGVTPSYTAVFPHRPKNHNTEVVVVVYLPSYEKDDIEARVHASNEIAHVAMMQAGTRPYAIIPLEKSLLPKSSLGKLSRAKLRTAFEKGTFATHQNFDQSAIKTWRAAKVEKPADSTEETVLDCFLSLFPEIERDEVGVNSSLLDWGVSSIEVIKLKTIIQKELALEEEIPVLTVMTNPTIRGLAGAVKKIQEPHVYDPIVTLQPNGDKTPIFLVHPGVGEVLVFLNLAKYITDRPVHSIRAKGFEKGEEYFKNIPEAVSTYYQAIKRTQPKGPYALAGYSYGAMLAFETAKMLESTGDEVKFLGSFNLPPHIKFRMRQLDYIEVLLNLSYFLDLITDEYAHQISPEMHKLTGPEVVDFIISKSKPGRMEEMALTHDKLANWAALSHEMHVMAHHYDPSGSIANIDVFYAIPLSAVAKDKKVWLDTHLSKWADFVRGDIRFTEVEGEHYTMMGPEYVLSFQKKFKQAMANRGI